MPTRSSLGSIYYESKDPVPLQLTLANNSTYPQQGHILFADRQVDPSTGTIRIVAAFKNPGNILRPGPVRTNSSDDNAMQRDALLVPQRAVTELQGRYQVAVVGATIRSAFTRWRSDSSRR